MALATERSALTERVYEIASSAVLEMGRTLAEGLDLLGRDGFNEWVENDLPFAVTTARRYIAIHRAYAELPPDVLERLPRPWQAMYALKALPPGQISYMVETEEISSRTSVREARAIVRKYKHDRWTGSPDASAVPFPSDADRAADHLMTYGPDELDGLRTARLRAWLESSGL